MTVMFDIFTGNLRIGFFPTNGFRFVDLWSSHVTVHVSPGCQAHQRQIYLLYQKIVNELRGGKFLVSRLLMVRLKTNDEVGRTLKQTPYHITSNWYVV